MKLKVMLVEDSPMIIKGLQYTIEQAGYDLDVFMSYEHAMRHVYDGGYDMCVLDVTLPDGSGYDICKAVKEDLGIPVIFLTARDTENDVVKGFDMGADDYIVKPFSPREVLARIKAVLRRFSEKASEEDSSIIRLPQLEISLENYQVKVSGKVIPCTPKEVEILHMLCSNVGQVFSREQILSRVWGYDYFGDTRTVDAHIKRRRQKLPQENVPWALKTVYGVGYRFEVNA